MHMDTKEGSHKIMIYQISFCRTTHGRGLRVTSKGHFSSWRYLEKYSVAYKGN